jgi:hypothetical protein
MVLTFTSADKARTSLSHKQIVSHSIIPKFCLEPYLTSLCQAVVFIFKFRDYGTSHYYLVECFKIPVKLCVL